ncbi:hypothetical protein [Actinomadura latina]|uniref:Uncharacterized protein n=1 Tax=Actinomadura latina TaxID=163603 RepID=A0A846YVY9_9ACTN|nr:hypothetical protein [Actinomadura latina]NKZ02842.1 hypothetical protein [Actinomadura latina]
MVDMARYRRDAQLEPFPRDLLDEVVRAILDAADEAPISERGFEFGDEVIDDVRLVEGRHLAAGARYRVEEDGFVAEAHVPAWNRAGESRIEVTTDAGGHTVNVQVDLRMAGRRLHTVRVTGDYQGPKPFRGLRRAKWVAEFRAEQWWSALGSKASPISLRVVHPFAFADLRISRGKDRRGRWSVRTAARFGGRSLLRPVAAVGLAYMRGRIRRTLDEGFTKTVAAWNAEVPGMAKRGMQERLSFEHRITLKAVSREWVETYVAALHREIEGLPFRRHRLVKDTEGAFSVRLLRGEHIRPGTSYRIAFTPEDEVEPVDVHVAAWEFDGPNRIEVSSPDDVQTGWIEIDSARKVGTVRAGFAGEFEGFTSVTAAAEADLERWWSAGSPLTGTAEHPVGEAALTVERVADDGGEWTVNVAATVEGHAWARHLVALAGVLSGPAMRRSFRENADAFAEKWNGAVPEAGPADQAAESTIRAVIDR